MRKDANRYGSQHSVVYVLWAEFYKQGNHTIAAVNMVMQVSTRGISKKPDE
ncbi:hypothetical protein APHWI1_0043 [Anaplasma phagocytophilum str. ApWI1]|nr:hypothetical protein EPHNCH_0855 [Anaplasma phagocytophilum str. NCH-1]KJV85493.1 hypothetical protein APHWI1_0043 [Anaplasma phagocytophilum str. ApWI1]KJZ99504.1 hypothetical protein APHCR_0071 [Anaplasma phagocytophilum str. CR1007]